MSDEIVSEVFAPVEIAIDPPAGGIDLVTLTADPAERGYYVFDCAAGTALTALPADEASVENAAADIRAAIAAWSVPTPPPVPSEVGPAQIRVAMLRAGLDPEEIDAAIEAIENEESRKEARYLWRHASTIQRDNWLVGQMGAILEISEEQIDDVFRAAAEI